MMTIDQLPPIKNRTQTLAVGSLAPTFTLQAANREASFSLEHLIARGPLIVEFLRGTW
jgi:peroxiredoxin